MPEPGQVPESGQVYEPAPTADKIPPNDFDGMTTGPGGDPPLLPPALGLDPVPPLTRESSGGGKVRVDTAAMRTFVKNMDQMQANMLKVRDVIDPSRLQVPAGAFAHAYQLRTNIMGTSTTAAGSETTSGVMPVVPGTFSFLQSAIDALAVVQRNMESIAALYEKTEDLNEEQTQQLAELMQDTAASLNTVTGANLAGTSETGNEPPL